jgi:DNA-binding SARP family transcriptional activator
MGVGIVKMRARERRSGDGLEIRLLGSLEVVRNGQPQPLPASRKTRALLAYLALATRPCRREELCELLWESVADPRGELRWSLSKLRAVLGHWLVAAQDSMSIAGTGLTIDAVDFRRLAGAGPTETDARKALTLWRGSPLADVDVVGLHRYHVWWLMEREALTELHGRLHHVLVDVAWSSPRDALAAARNLITQHPYDEWGHARVAQALKRAGRAADARAYVETTRNALARELGVTPSSIMSVAPPEPCSPTTPPTGPTRQIRSPRPLLGVWPLQVLPGDEPLQAVGAYICSELEHGFWRSHVCDVAGSGSFVPDAEAKPGLSYALYGALTRLPDGLRLSLRCVGVRRNAVIWCAQFGPEQELTPYLGAWIHRAVGAIQSSIQTAEIRYALAGDGSDHSIHARLMSALALCLALEPAANQRALAGLVRILHDQPDEPRALALAAWCHAQRCVYNWSVNPDADRSDAERYTVSATRLGADDPTCLTIIGAARSVIADQKGARLLLNRALELNPAASWAHARSGWVANYTDEPDQAIREFRAAMQLAPHDSTIFNSMIGLGVAHFIKGEHGPAIDWMEKGLAINPLAIWVYRNLVPAYVAAGRRADARSGVLALIGENRALSVAAVRDAMVFSRPTMARISQALHQSGLALT